MTRSAALLGIVVPVDVTHEAEATVGHQSDDTFSRMTGIAASVGVQRRCVRAQHLFADVAQATRPVAHVVILVAIATVGRGRGDCQAHAGDMA